MPLRPSFAVSLIGFAIASILHSQTADPVPLKTWSAPAFWDTLAVPPGLGSTAEKQIERRLSSATGAPLTGLLSFVGIVPCRLVDTRGATGETGAFGPPIMSASQTRTIPILSNTRCNIPATAQAYSLNFTVVPVGFLGFLSAWPTGNPPSPLVSILNDFTGTVLANAAVIAAGTAGSFDVFVTDPSQVIIDINGYYTSQVSSGGASLPVGTVVYSMLNAATFSSQQAAGQTWILADGRSIAGLNLSYETLTSSSAIPNLLGVFVRGKNNGRSDGNQNPDGDLPLGQFTADRFQSHDHGGGNHSHNTSTQNGAAPDFGGIIVRIPGSGTFDSATSSSGAIINAQGGAETSPKSVTMNPFIRVN
jgi:hypothetical protein